MAGYFGKGTLVFLLLLYSLWKIFQQFLVQVLEVANP